MANEHKTFTAPLAIIKVGDTVIGKMKNLRFTENYRRGRVTGIGQVNAVELPLLEFTGTFTCSFYTVDIDKHPLLRDALLRKTGTSDKLLNTVKLQELGLQVKLVRLIADKTTFPPEGRDANGIIQVIEQEFATVDNAFITSDGFDLNEGQISGHDSTFEYLEPVNFAIN